MPGRPPVCKPSASFLRYDRAEDGRKGLRWYPAERVNRYAAPGRRPFVCRPRKREPPALQGSRSVAGGAAPDHIAFAPPPRKPCLSSGIARWGDPPPAADQRKL